MTKKFWKDWQTRIGETKNIGLFFDGARNGFFHFILNNDKDRLIKATFHGDAVDLVIERHTTVFNKATWGFHNHVENEYTTLHRNEIATIKFIKY